jgi:hypothetical protein
MWHYLWHGTRALWSRLTPNQKAAIRAVDSRWEPPRPAFDAIGRPERDNDSGEDFLFMHRQMITRANQVLAQADDPTYPRVEGWRTLPEPTDSEYPVAPVAGVGPVKSPQFFQTRMQPLERQFTDAAHLRTLTLGQLGNDLENDIHNDMHMRWAAPSGVGYRPNTPITAPVGPQWDQPSYDFLGDTYSSHVNPWFWKIHGWIDDRIEDWARANGIGQIEWTGTWIGALAGDHHHGMAPHALNVEKGAAAIDSMSEIARVLAETKVFTGFFQPSVRP